MSCISPEASYCAAARRCSTPRQAKWTSPITSRFLLEVGQSLAVPTYKFKYQPENGPFDVSICNRPTGVRTVASATAPHDYFNEIWNTVANASYVTGSHNFKFGVNHQWGYRRPRSNRNGDMSVLTFTNNAAGVATPSTVDAAQHAVHRAATNLNANLGLFAQDKWTLSRLTLSYGGRYDYFNALGAGASRRRRAVSCRPQHAPRGEIDRACLRAGTTGRSASARPTISSATARPR